jgi:hypothetical protein
LARAGDDQYDFEHVSLNRRNSDESLQLITSILHELLPTLHPHPFLFFYLVPISVAVVAAVATAAAVVVVEAAAAAEPVLV